MAEPIAQFRAPVPQLLRPEVIIGASSPLWAYFTGAVAVGVGWWWTARWMRRTGFEALAEAATAPAVEGVTAIAAVAEAATKPVLKTAAEAAGGPVAEALAREEIPAAPVGGEAAPFGPAALEAERLSEPSAAAEPAEQEKPAVDLARDEKPAAQPKPRRSRESQAKPH